VQILCSHVRSKTSETEYQKTHKERPSNEIQTTLNLLFKEHKRGLYAQDFAKVTEFPGADLSHAYLVEADFEDVQCQGANFRFAQCQGANFRGAQCQRADFALAHCQGANFQNVQCQGASFQDVQCQEAFFAFAHCQGADFSNAQCQRVCFMSARCQGANFRDAQCQVANFRYAQCQGADFWYAQCQGANFWYAQCQGANFLNTQCQGAYTLNESSNSRIGKETEFETLQLEGEIAKDVIKNIKNAKNYFSDFKYKEIRTIIQDNTGKKIKFGMPKYCTTGILEDSEELQAIIKEDWKKLEQLNKKQHD
jgi:uncharacterized protein YjbI with pentapeptide repeats